MAHHIDWNNIHHHIQDNDVRYQRRLRRKRLYIACSPCVPPVHPTSNLNNLQTVVSRVDPDMEMCSEGFRESERLLVCKDGDNVSDDVSLEILENGQHGNDFLVECSSLVANSEPIGVKCGSGGDFVDPDVKMFKEDLTVKCGTKEDVVDPDFKMFMEDLVVDGHSFGLKVKRMDGSIQYIEYEKDELCKEYQTKGNRVENVLGRRKGDTLGNDIKERKRGKVVPRGDVDSVSTKNKRNVKVCGAGFSRNSNRFTVAKRKSVVKKADDIEIIFIGKPNEIEEVTVSTNYRPSKIIKKNKKPSKMDGGCNMDYLRKSKKQYEKPQRRPCLTRTDHVSNQAMMSRQSAKYRRTIPKNEPRDLVVWQSKDIQNSKFSSGTGNMAVMVKEEKFDDSTNVFLVEKSMQVIPGRDSVYDNNLQPQYKCDKSFGKYAELKEENAKRLNYDKEDDEDSSDLEILEMGNPQNLSKFELTKVFNDSDMEDSPVGMKTGSDYKTSAFREELMVILKKPYNLEEYRSLMQKAKYRHLNWAPEYSDGLKGKDISNIYGKSPLDYHPDVQRRLRRCRRFSKRLNILRGFIYWYGRTCQDGAFKPWLDKSCLEVTPSPC